MEIKKEFNYFPLIARDKSWKVSIHIEQGNVSAKWGADAEPNIEDLEPVEVLVLIYKQNRNEMMPRWRAEQEAAISKFLWKLLV